MKNEIDVRGWMLALDNMIDCAERGQPLHAIDIARLKQLRDLFESLEAGASSPPKED